MTAAERLEQAAQRKKMKSGPGLFDTLKSAIFGDSPKEVVQK